MYTQKHLLGGVLQKKLVLKMLQNWQENTWVSVFFTKEIPTQVFSCQIFLIQHLRDCFCTPQVNCFDVCVFVLTTACMKNLVYMMQAEAAMTWVF